MNILSSFINPHVVANLSFFFCGTQKSYYEELLACTNNERYFSKYVLLVILGWNDMRVNDNKN